MSEMGLTSNFAATLGNTDRLKADDPDKIWVNLNWSCAANTVGATFSAKAPLKAGLSATITLLIPAIAATSSTAFWVWVPAIKQEISPPNCFAAVMECLVFRDNKPSPVCSANINVDWDLAKFKKADEAWKKIIVNLHMKQFSILGGKSL